MNSEEIVNFRLSKNWNQLQMARNLGVTQATVSRWENGAPINGPALKLLQLLAQGAEWPDGIARPDVAGSVSGDNES